MDLGVLLRATLPVRHRSAAGTAAPNNTFRIGPAPDALPDPTIRSSERSTMFYYTNIYLATLVGFFAIDIVWLAFVARGFYRRHLDFLLKDRPNWWAAIPFYLLFVAGMVVFAIGPALQSDSMRQALLLGAFYGLVTYATYDLTNHATVKNWPWIVTAVDLCWGVVLATSVSSIGYLAGRWLDAT
jgi:uncharacterized membrane protein